MGLSLRRQGTSATRPKCCHVTPTKAVARPDDGSLGAGIALGVLLGLAYLWLDHHGSFRSSTPAWLAGLGLVVATLTGWMRTVQPGRAKGLTQQGLERLRRHVRIRTALVAWSVAAITGCSLTTIRVDAAPERVSVHAVEGTAPRDITKWTSGGTTPTFLVLTSPFGRDYVVEVSGKTPRRLVARPGASLHVDPARDLEPSPSILLRPSPEGLQQLESEGLFAITLRGKTIEEPKARKALLLGPVLDVDPLLELRWDRELLGRLTADNAAPLRARVLNAWTSPYHRADVLPLPGDRLCAQIISRAGNVVCRTCFEVVPGTFQHHEVETVGTP